MFKLNMTAVVVLLLTLIHETQASCDMDIKADRRTWHFSKQLANDAESTTFIGPLYQNECDTVDAVSVGQYLGCHMGS